MIRHAFRTRRQRIARRVVRRAYNRHFLGPHHCVLCGAALEVNHWFCDEVCYSWAVHVLFAPHTPSTMVDAG